MAAPRGSLVSDAAVAQLRRSAVQQGVLVDRKALFDIERRTDEHRFRGQMNLLLGVSVACLGAYVYIKVSGLAREYPVAYAWWERSQALHGRGDSAHPQITLPKAALRVEFPAFYYVQSLAMVSESLPLHGAQFLVVMASHFSKYLRPVHWNGSAAELRYADYQRFLPPDAKSASGVRWTYVWAAWTAKNAAGDSVNPWDGVLFASVQAMANSPAVQAYYADVPDRRYIAALFRGGLVEVAVTLGGTDTTGVEMARHLMGFQSGAYVIPCGGSRGERAVQTSLEYGMYGGMVGGLGGHALASRFAEMGSRGERFGKLLPLLITAASFAGGAAKGATEECAGEVRSYSGFAGSGGETNGSSSSNESGGAGSA